MRYRTYALATILFAVLVRVTDAGATAQRTFVASHGNDGNPCSLALPCRGFAAAIAQTASGGEVIVLDSAGYGTVTITQSVSIIAPPGVYAGITVPAGDGVTITGGEVALRGLTINGLGGADGISANSTGLVQVEDCNVTAMTNNGLTVAAGTAAAVRRSSFVGNLNYGIATAGFVTVSDSTIDRNHFAGIYASGGAVAVTDSTLNLNSGFGLFAVDAGSGVSVAVDRTTLHGNGTNGVQLAGTGGTLTMARTLVEGNGLKGLHVITGAHATVTGSVVAHNESYGFDVASSSVTLESVKVTNNGLSGIFMEFGGTVQTLGNNTIVNNGSPDVSGGSLTGVGGLQ